MYYPDDEGRQEYVLSDVGAIYMGSKETLLSRDWVFGQVRSRTSLTGFRADR